MATKSWDDTARVCEHLLADRRSFDAEERDYKLVIAEKIRSAVEAARTGADLPRPIRQAFGPPNNLTNWRSHSEFVKWVEGHAEEARQSILALTDESSAVKERVDRFLEGVPPEVLDSPGARIGVASFFLMGQDPAQFSFYKPTPYTTVERVLGHAGPPSDSSAGAVYQHHLDFALKFLAELQQRGVPARDVLDAQSLIWMLAVKKDPACFEWRGEAPTAGPTTKAAASRDIPDLEDDLLLGDGFLQGLIKLLKDKKQVVLYGPPGTGKTFVARRLREHLAPGVATNETVQFHPSYSYEDFVQGYRPVVEPGAGMVYRLKDGPLVRLAKHARNSQEDHLLVIDEINRGNLPRILGELLYLLEYRDNEVQLMYGDERFMLPSNLMILATMNTVDRSIGVIDAALRRRFHFVPMFPDRPPVQGLLRAWLERECPEMLDVANLLDRLNEELRKRFGRHVQLGPSYFMKEGLSEESLRTLWDHDIVPFIEEQFFDDEQELERWTMDRLRG